MATIESILSLKIETLKEYHLCNSLKQNYHLSGMDGNSSATTIPSVSVRNSLFQAAP